MKIELTSRFWRARVTQGFSLFSLNMKSYNFDINNRIYIAKIKPVEDYLDTWNCILIAKDDLFLWGASKDNQGVELYMKLIKFITYNDDNKPYDIIKNFELTANMLESPYNQK